jgi:hypothetical protein
MMEPESIVISPAEERERDRKREEAARAKQEKAAAEDKARYERDKAAGKIKSTFPRGSAGGGGMNPADIEKVPGKKPLKMAKGGYVKAADGCVKRGKTKGKMV